MQCGKVFVSSSSLQEMLSRLQLKLRVRVLGHFVGNK